jgi:hypothetical protein
MIDSSSTKAVSFSSAHTFVRGPLQDQTHRELVYSPLEFHGGSQLFVAAHNESLSVAMRVHNPDRSPLKIQS